MRLRNGLRCQACNIFSFSQAIPILEQNTLCPSAEFQGRHLEFPCQEKAARHCFQLTPGRRLFLFCSAHDSESYFISPVSTKKRIITEHDQCVETLTASICTRSHDRADLSNPLFVDMDSGVGGVMQSPGELDSSAVRLQSNLDEPDDWDNAPLSKPLR